MFKPKKETNPYKQKHDFGSRKHEADRIRKKYAEQYPVIVLRGKKCTLPPLDKNKFIVSGDMTLAQVSEAQTNHEPILGSLRVLPHQPIHAFGWMQFHHVIRSRSKLSASQSIYVYVELNGKLTIPETSNTMSQLYDRHKDADGFLYVTYYHDDAFGSSCRSSVTQAVQCMAN
eukprot:TRINITY_DN6366_c0_g1_i1.p1 TRINITY_DN6366_c0_g1~~TRINITY_DN6366_c0_g1_i1.p1  ORF type:complete len:173 (+),score=12.41 TRINITY_DN6366_c0_g1_i1:188-706(+)